MSTLIIEKKKKSAINSSHMKPNTKQQKLIKKVRTAHPIFNWLEEILYLGGEYKRKCEGCARQLQKNHEMNRGDSLRWLELHTIKSS